ncbi:MAG: hypothetical protein Fur002_08970 [Anaerolineales bacterium]
MNWLFGFFTSEEDSSPSFLRLVKTALIFVIVGNIALLPLVYSEIDPKTRDMTAILFLVAALIINGIALYYVQKSKPKMAKLAVPLSLILVITFIASSQSGLRDLSILGLPLALVVSALLLGKRAMTLMLPMTLISLAVIAFFDVRSDKPIEASGWTQAAILAVLLIITAVVVQMLVNRLSESIAVIRQSEQAHIEENRELNELRQALEERVAVRTFDLQKVNQDYERRAKQFNAIAQVTRAIISIQDLDVLLPYITQIISEQFGVYHTGIFLLDKEREYAVLRAANSEGGRAMLQRGHKLRVGQVGIIGYVAAAGQARIALDVGADAVYFNNPDLPGTHSEIGLPLSYAGQIIGALDVQSTETNAFTDKDIEVLNTLAEQVAATISNVIALDEMRKEIERYKALTGDVSREAWKVMRPRSLGIGFALEKSEVRPLQEPLSGAYIEAAIAQNKTAQENLPNGDSALALPIRLREKTIGVIHLRSSARRFTQDDADIVEAVTERLSLALETATLLQTTRHRADVERVTTEISAQISSSSRFETILQTAAQELSRALGGSDVLVQIEPLSMELGTNE